MEPKVQSVEEKILQLLERGPVTPDEVAQELGIAWATAQGFLMRLVAAGKLAAARKGRVNIYFLRFPARVTPSIPSWAKVRDLEELSRELEPYFPRDVSAAEMIDRERRRS